ncbi:hypothetical protein D3C71_1583070 [compost metagenome]
MARHADNADALHLNLFAVFKCGCEAAGERAFLHIKYTAELGHGAGCQIKRCAVDINVDADPVGAVQDLGKILRIAVFPPADPCFVRIIDACHVAALQAVAAVLLFKVGSAAHVAVTDAEDTLGNFLGVRIKGFFNNGPFINFEILFHCFWAPFK